MAPIKFEENIKDKLEKRTLSPSVDSWSKLSERLDSAEKKSKNPIFWWLSVAAGLIVMLAVTVHFFNNDTEQDIPVIVDEKVKERRSEIKIPIIEEKESIELVIDAHSTEVLKEDMSNPVKSQIIDYKKIRKNKSENKNRLANRAKGAKEKLEPNGISNGTSVINEESYVKVVIAEALKEQKFESKAVTDREVDSLLKLASKELFKEKLQDESTKTVYANALLRSVEEEMGESFRTKVFEALKESYETVKTAVAERNN